MNTPKIDPRTELERRADEEARMVREFTAPAIPTAWLMLYGVEYRIPSPVYDYIMRLDQKVKKLERMLDDLRLDNL